jgi:hypothetical protein
MSNKKDKKYCPFHFRGIAEVSYNVYLIPLRAIEPLKNSGQKPPPLGPNRVNTIHLNYILMHQTSFYLSVEKEPVD